MQPISRVTHLLGGLTDYASWLLLQNLLVTWPKSFGYELKGVPCLVDFILVESPHFLFVLSCTVVLSSLNSLLLL